MGGGDGDRDLKIEAIRGGVRDLKIDDAAAEMEAAAMGGGDRGLASEGVDTLKKNGCKLNVVGLLAVKSWKEAVASEAADDRDLKRKEAIRPKEGEILRLKKEMYAAWDLWFLTCKKLRKKTQEEPQAPGEATQESSQAPGAGNKRKEEAQAPGPGKKRKKVVKIKLSDEYVEHMRACPFSILPDYSDEELARSTPYRREMYAAGRFLEAKNRAYWNALIAQKDDFGCAEDENEVTDDEEEVVKN